MSDIYAEMADLMLTTMAGQMAALTHEQLVQTFKAKFPNEGDFRVFVETIKAQAAVMVQQAQDSCPEGREVAVGYLVGTPDGPLH